MNKDRDIEAMIAAAKARGEIPNSGGVPPIGQGPQIMHGLPVNGGLITINEVEGMSERAFRELVIGVFVNLIGGIYVPPKPREAPAADAEEEGVVSSGSSDDEPVEEPSNDVPAEDVSTD